MVQVAEYPETVSTTLGSNQIFDILIDQTTFIQIAAAGELKVVDDKVGCMGEQSLWPKAS